MSGIGTLTVPENDPLMGCAWQLRAPINARNAMTSTEEVVMSLAVLQQ